MENNPFQNRSENSSKGSEKKSGAAPFGYQPAVERPAYQPLEQFQEQQRVPRVPTEGIISWRDTDEVRERETVEDSTRAKAEESKDEDKTKSTAKPAQPVQPLAPQPVERPVSPFPELTEYVEEAKAEEQKEPSIMPSAETVPGALPRPETADQPVMPERQVAYSAEYPAPAPQAVHATETQPMAPGSAEHHYTPPELANPQFVRVQPGEAPTVSPGDSEFPAPAEAAAPQPPQPGEYPYPVPSGEQPVWPSQPDSAPVPPPQPGEFATYPAAASGLPTAETPSFASAPPERPEYAYGYDPYNNPALPTVEHSGAGYASTPNMPIERPHQVVTNNRDPRVGPVAALLGLEYFGRKRADRKLERRMNQRLEQSNKEQAQRQQTEHQRLADQQRQFGVEQQRQANSLNSLQYQLPDRYASTAPARPATTERPMTLSTPSPEARRVEAAPGTMQRPETNQPTPEQTQQPAEEVQPINLQPGQHVERSSWHNIVVDRRGHEVTGAIEYGEGFQRERQQEARPEPIATTDAAGAASDNTMMSQYQPTYPGALPSGMTMPSLPQGQPTHADPQHQLPARGERNTPASNLTNPWFWIMLILIVAAFFTAAMV